MSGHSKWHNIAAKKGKADAARGKVFTKLGRELLMAVKQGGADPAGNSKLKDVIAKCKAANMPNDTINNAIKKAAGAAKRGDGVCPGAGGACQPCKEYFFIEYVARHPHADERDHRLHLACGHPYRQP